MVELVEMVRLYAVSGDSVSQAIEMFVELFPNRQRPSQRVMLADTQRLREFRQFDVPYADGRGNEGLPVALQEDILQYFQREPRGSTRDAGRRFGVHHSTVFPKKAGSSCNSKGSTTFVSTEQNQLQSYYYNENKYSQTRDALSLRC